MVIGQIVYLIFDSKIEPVQIISITTREDFSGVHSEHMCAVLHDDGTVKTKVTLESFKQKYFLSLADAQDHLLKLASKTIESLGAYATKKCSFFEKSVNSQQSKSDSQPDTAIKNYSEVVLPDGTRARVHLPEELLT